VRCVYRMWPRVSTLYLQAARETVQRGGGAAEAYSTTSGTSEERERVTWLANGVARVKRFRYLREHEPRATRARVLPHLNAKDRVTGSSS
jgi:hypothetical protein